MIQPLNNNFMREDGTRIRVLYAKRFSRSKRKKLRASFKAQVNWMLDNIFGRKHG